jgi:transposase-like protein
MAQFHFTVDSEIVHGLFSIDGRDQAFKALHEEILNQVLETEITEQIQAEKYERTSERKAYRNGHRERQLTTRVGTLTLTVPRLRNGEFSTELFQRYQRSEQALVLTMMEMYVNGVSTRKVGEITETLCGKNFSKSTISDLAKRLDPIVEGFRNRPLDDKKFPFLIVDALYTKARHQGRVKSRGILIASGINEDGYREIVGFAVAKSETKDTWSRLFENLKDRGISGIETVVSDDHKGLVAAIEEHFIGASWQRCQTHFSRNILEKAPKSIRPELKEMLRAMFTAPNIEIAREIRDEIIATFGEKAPKAIEILDRGFDDATHVLYYPSKYRKRLRTTNMQERVNREVRRRERVISIFPNDDSIVRIIGSVLLEIHENWISGKRYFDMEEFHSFMKEQREKEEALDEPQSLAVGA